MIRRDGLEDDDSVRRLISELDSVFGKWVESRIAPLEELPPTERYDRLVEIEESVREGAAEILDRLGIEGSRHFKILPDSLESVSAELQYAQAAPNHAARVALLRLDQERADRLEKVMVIEDASEREHAMSELDIWYDVGLGRIFDSGEIAGE